MTTAIYARLSRAANDDELAVKRQQDDCRALCEREGWPVHRVYVDNDFSAFTGKTRPEYERMIGDLKNGEIVRVVAWHPDRLHRSPRELEDFVDLIEATGADVVTVTAGAWNLSTPEDRCMARIVGAIARKESEDKSRRLRRKHAELAASGQLSGGGVRPYGYRRVKNEAGRIVREELVPAEADVIRECMARFLAGESLRSITVDLNARGVPTAGGKLWSPAVVRGILGSARISGQREHQGRIVAAASWPAIVTVEQTAQARSILASTVSNGRTVRRYLLTGLLRCGRCGARMVARPRANGKRGYTCAKGPGRPGCGLTYALAEPVETLITKAAILSLDSPDTTRLLAETPAEAPGDAQAALVTAQQQLDELAGAYGAQAITLSEWLTARKAIETRIDVAAHRPAVRRRRAALDGFVGNSVSLRERWATFDLTRRHSILAAVIDRVVVNPGVRGRKRFDPSRFDIVWRS